jgi:hypothetical protein
MNSVKEVQEWFTGLFPFLKINFYKTPMDGNKMNGHRVLFYPEVKMKDIRQDFTDGEFEIRDTMTVLELETGFYELLGLSVQVLRKSGNLWLKTSGSNSWTLKEQNDHGREISPEQKDKPGNIREIPFNKRLG